LWAYGLRLPRLARIEFRRAGGVANVPHLWKERNVCAHRGGAATKRLAFGEIRGLVSAVGSHLE